MIMSSRGLLLILTLAAWFMFFAGLIAEYGFALYPCSMCLYQRYTHFAIGALGLMLYKIRGAHTLVLLSGVWFGSFALSSYHVGIEHKIFPAPKSCAHMIHADSIEDLRASLQDRPVVRCDVPAWNFLGISMAGWNALASFLLAFMGVAGFRILRRHHE